MAQGLINNVLRGNFAHVENNWRSETVNDKIAFDVILASYTPIAKPEIKDQIPIESLKNVLLFSCQSIKKLPPGTSIQFGNVLYHIMNFFITKKQFNNLLELESLWLTNLLDLKEKNLGETYLKICYLLSNKIHEFLETTITDSSFGKLCILCMKMFIRVPSIDSLKKKANLCFNPKYFLTIQAKEQITLYLDFFKFMANNYPPNSNFYTNLMDVITSMLRNISKQKNTNTCEPIIYFLSETLTIINRLPLNKEQNSFLDAISASKSFIKHFSQSTNITPSLELLYKRLNVNSNNYDFYTTCNVIYIICYSILKVVNENNSSKVLHSQNLLLMSKIFKIISNTMAKTATECINCSCNVKTDLKLSHYANLFIVHMATEGMQRKVEISKEMHKIIRQHIETICINILKIKNANCSKWKGLWNEIGCSLYNISGKLFNMKNQLSSDYFLLLLKYVITLEGLNATIIKEDLVYRSLQCLTENCFNSKDYLKTLMYAAINLLYFPSNAKRIFWFWSQTKSSLKDHKEQYLQELTTICVLQKCHEEITEFFPNFFVNEEEKANLLLLELRYYKSMWPSKIPMLKTYKQFHQIANFPLLLKATTEIFTPNLTLHKEVFKLIEETLIKFTSNFDSIPMKDYEKKIHLAHLYYTHYRNKLTLMREQNYEEMNKVITPLKQSITPEEEEINDECDVVPAYANLKLAQCLDLINLLDKSIELFTECILKDAVEVLQQTNSLETIKNLADEYSLQCFSIKALKVWYTALRLSKLLEEDAHTLDCIGNILKLANSSLDHKDLLRESDKIIEKCDNEILTKFYVNKSLFLLNRGRIAEGYEVFKKAEMCLEALNGKTEMTLNARLQFVHMQYLMLPCDFQIPQHDACFALKFHQILSDYMDFFKNGHRTAQDILTLFEVTQYVSSTYRSLHAPREVRCYTREILQLSQRLIVPLRTCYFLINLAIADLESLRIDDCQVKLEGLAYILCLNQSKRAPVKTVEIETTSVKAEDVEVLTDRFNEIMLKCPSTTQDLEGSPILIANKFEMPAFFYHNPKCECYYCIDHEYHSLVLTKLTLEAQLNLHKSKSSAANDFYNGGLQLYASFSTRKISTKEKIQNLYGIDVYNDWENVLHQAYAYLMFSFCNYQLNIKNYKKAEQINSKLISELEEINSQNVYFYNEIIFQKRVIMSLLAPKETKSKMYLSVPTDVDDSFYKTPDHRFSKVLLPKTLIPHSVPIKKAIRAIKFDLPDDDPVSPSVPPHINVPTITITEEMNNKHETTHDENLFPKTPALNLVKIPSIEITTIKPKRKQQSKLPPKTPASKRTTSKTKKISVKAEETEISPLLAKTPAPSVIIPSTTITTIKPRKKKEDSEDDDYIPESPKAYTPSALKIGQMAIRTRSRILTEKLKKTVINKENFSPNEVPIARKNLMSDLKKVDEEIHKDRKPVRRNLRSSKK